MAQPAKRAGSKLLRRTMLDTAVKNLLLADGATQGMILAYDRASGLCVLPAWIPEHDDQDSDCGGRIPARVEYQVSDGLDGRRSESFDFYDLDKAMACYRRSVAAGKLVE